MMSHHTCAHFTHLGGGNDSFVCHSKLVLRVRNADRTSSDIESIHVIAYDIIVAAKDEEHDGILHKLMQHADS